ncbi:MAG: type-F conjugative transfer system pilin assembly protein TrbC [Sphingomonadales bacterium]|jgi:conjugal transfer pilus assembly protein TrbC|nr:type-F conjugative transfer system pilin assembly protein TrbC [Sphingomonadales bacterium]
MARKMIIAGVAVALTVGGWALAQTVETINVGALLNKAEADGADQEAFARDVMKRGEAMREQASETAAAGQAAAPFGTRTMRMGADGKIDFDAVVDGAGAEQDEAGVAPRLIVFASLSMPTDSLKALIRDAGKAGASVVFRGFPGNSMKAFQEGILKVVAKDEEYGNIGIDPRLFRAFNVTGVPTFVAVSSDFDPCDGFDCTTQVPPFDRMSGNVTLGFVLDTFASGKGPGAPVAEIARRRMEAGGS